MAIRPATWLLRTWPCGDISKLTFSKTSRKISFRRYFIPSRRHPIWPVTFISVDYIGKLSIKLQQNTVLPQIHWKKRKSPYFITQKKVFESRFGRLWSFQLIGDLIRAWLVNWSKLIVVTPPPFSYKRLAPIQIVTKMNRIFTNVFTRTLTWNKVLVEAVIKSVWQKQRRPWSPTAN